MENPVTRNQSSFELLPAEVISIIAKYLNLRDILECCATSSTMRELFSHNFIWRPRCDKQLADYLKKTPCKVNPLFSDPEIKNSSLSALSEWRMSFIRENQLWDNWREGRYVKDPLDTSGSVMFYNNDCVIVKYKDKIDLLNVKLIPASKILEINLEMSPNFEIQLANDLIVVLNGSRVQVFGLDLDKETAELKHSFYFEHTDKSTADEISANSNISHLQEEGFRGKRVIVGNFFVGVLQDEMILHIWNLKDCEKLKEEVVQHPVEQCSVLQIEASSNNHVVLAIGKDGQETKTFVAYSLTELKFLSFHKTHCMNSVFKVHKNFFLIMSGHTVQVFDLINSEMLGSMHSQCFPKVIKNSLWFVENGKFCLFHLIKRTLRSISYAANPLPVRDYGNPSFEVIGDKFLQTYTTHTTIGFGGKIWEIDETNFYLKKTITDFAVICKRASLNKACTRCITQVFKTEIAHFW